MIKSGTEVAKEL